MTRVGAALALIGAVGCGSVVIDNSEQGDGADQAAFETCEPEPVSREPNELCSAFCKLYACSGCDNEPACRRSCEAFVSRRPADDCQLELLACAAEHIDMTSDPQRCRDTFSAERFVLTFPLEYCDDCR
jgi:hypothetical protein